MALRRIHRNVRPDLAHHVALQAAVQLGWAQQIGIPGRYCITQTGREVREQAEQLTNRYFYAPWSVLTKNELYEFSNLLLKLKDQLELFRKRKSTVTSAKHSRNRV